MAMLLISSKTLTTSSSNIASVEEKRRDQMLKVQGATHLYWNASSLPYLIGIIH